MGNFAVNLPYTEISLRGLKLCRRCCRNRNLLKDGSQKYRYRKLKDDSQNLKDGSRKCRYRKLMDDSQNLTDGSQNLCARYCRLHWQKDGSLSTDGSQMFHGLLLRDGSRKRDGSQMFHGLLLRDGSRKRDVTGHGCKRVC